MSKLIVIALLVAACTRPNPNRCCTDEANCAAVDLPVGSTCEGGLVCRGNQCIAVPCAASSECEASAPYCVGELCAETCTEDAQCPGFGEDVAQRFCVDSTCRECRTGMNDCSTASPICDGGECRACARHAECESGVCLDNGACANESEISYVEVTGSESSECTRISPCGSIARALAVTPTRTYVVVASGTYMATNTISPIAERWIIGAGTPPVLKRSTPGPIVTVGGGSAVRLENLEIVGATAGTGADQEGYGIFCRPSNGTPTLRLRNVTVRESALNGLSGYGCMATANESAFLNNGEFGVKLGDSTASFDRCLVSENHAGMQLDGGLYYVTNSIIVRNSSDGAHGIDLYSVHSGHRIEFNTIADNVDTSGANYGAGIRCNLSAPASFPNNIIVRNTRQTMGAACTFPSSIIADTDISALKFKSPDATPYDYHITAGSSAIDVATQSTIDHDFDGQPRSGARDVGADEFVP